MKILLLDADGVVLSKGEYFSDKFAREHDVSKESVIEFFQGPFGECQAGKRDLKVELVPYLERWKWEGTVDSFLEYWFEDVMIDPSIEPVLAYCKEQGISCYMASNNEAYRARRIEKVLGDVLDGYFFSADLKAKKDDPTYFSSVLKELASEPSAVGFVDNEQKNVTAAKELGINAKLFKGDETWLEFWPGFQQSEFTNELQ